MKIFTVEVSEDALDHLRRHDILVEQGDVVTPIMLHEWLVNLDYDAVILNLDEAWWGSDALQYLRKKRISIPIIGIRQQLAKWNWSDQRATFLNRGGDDLVPAQEHDELVASLHAVTRRGHALFFDTQHFEIGDARLTINFRALQMTGHGQALNLTTAEQRMLRLMASHLGVVRTRGELADTAGLDIDSADRNVDGIIKRIRKKLKSIHEDAPFLIETYYGSGYSIPGHTISVKETLLSREPRAA